MKTKKEWVTFAIVATLVGGALYGIGALNEESLWFAPLMKIGEAIIIGAAIAFFIERRVHADMKALMQESATTAVQRWVEATAITRGAHALDLEGIFVRRGTQEETQHYLAAIETTFKRAAQADDVICILCVAGPEFFQATRMHFPWFRDEFTRKEAKVRLRVLLLDPVSEAAAERARHEFGHNTLEDISRAAKSLQWLQEKTGRVEYKFYARTRSNFLVLTSHTVLQEAYPVAPMRQEQGPIGGLTALVQYRQGSRAYARWKAHFEYEWREARDPGGGGHTV